MDNQSDMNQGWRDQTKSALIRELLNVQTWQSDPSLNNMDPGVLMIRENTLLVQKPEKEVLYQVIADNLETFLERIRAEGYDLPDYVVQEFYSYLDCGILARGFARCACESCGKSFAVAYCCKGRKVEAYDQAGLEQLCSYIARPPLAAGTLEKDLGRAVRL